MIPTTVSDRLEQLSALFFILFAAGCTFSIAVAQTSLALASAVFIILIFLEPRKLFKQTPFDLYLALGGLIAWTWLSGFLVGGFGYAINEIEPFWIMVALPVGWFAFRRARLVERLLMILAILVLLGGLAGILQLFTGLGFPGVADPVPGRSWGYRAQGFFSSRMTFAQVFVPFVLMFIFLGWKRLKSGIPGVLTRLYLLSGIIGGIGVVLALSRSSLAAIVVGLIVTGLMLGRKQLGLVIGLLIITGALAWWLVPDFRLKMENTSLIDLRDYKVAGRQFIWSRSLEIAEDNLWLGIGSERFEAEFVSRLDDDFDDDRIPGDAHSDWLNQLVINGIPGVLLLLALWLVVIRRVWRAIKDADDRERPLRQAALVGLIGILVMTLPVTLLEDSEMAQVITLFWLLSSAPTDGSFRTNKISKE